MLSESVRKSLVAIGVTAVVSAAILLSTAESGDPDCPNGERTHARATDATAACEPARHDRAPVARAAERPEAPEVVR
ncbi:MULTISPECIES: hypothetical protein [Cupriavidus]